MESPPPDSFAAKLFQNYYVTLCNYLKLAFFYQIRLIIISYDVVIGYGRLEDDPRPPYHACVSTRVTGRRHNHNQ